jgi:hypothetical protein
MRLLALLFCVALPAHADLYRWIDPESGSVKLSTQPPTDPGINAELVLFRHPAAPPPQAATGTTAKPRPAANALAALEARWSELLGQITGAKPQDLSRSGQGWQQHVEAYEAVRTELDRLDPAGAVRRRNEASTILERLKQGFATQFNPPPPGGQQK